MSCNGKSFIFGLNSQGVCIIFSTCSAAVMHFIKAAIQLQKQYLMQKVEAHIKKSDKEQEIKYDVSESGMCSCWGFFASFLFV